MLVCPDLEAPETLPSIMARLCQLGERLGMHFHFEPTPWTGLRTLAQAARLVKTVGRVNASRTQPSNQSVIAASAKMTAAKGKWLRKGK